MTATAVVLLWISLRMGTEEHNLSRPVQQIWDNARGDIGCAVSSSSKLQFQIWDLGQGPPWIFSFSGPVGLCVHSGEAEGRALRGVCCINKYLGSGQILCIIPAMVFVIREMPFCGWVLFFPSSSLSQAWRKQ